MENVMIRCLECRELYLSSANACTSCGLKTPRIEGFISWAPELAYGGAGFKAEYFDNLAKLEACNFWFRGRNALILWAILKYFPNFESFMEIGCGTGFVLSAIASRFPGRRLVGSELFVKGLHFARRRLPGSTYVQLDACRIPYEKEFDVIGVFDVLEHIEDDRTALRNMFCAVKPGGGVIISVPQHDWLWSSVDDYACHARRYEVTNLQEKVRSVGFDIMRSTSFVSLLLPAMLLSRRCAQVGEVFDPLKEFRISWLINKPLEGILAIERVLIRMGLTFPIGGSRLIVARKVA